MPNPSDKKKKKKQNFLVLRICTEKSTTFVYYFLSLNDKTDLFLTFCLGFHFPTNT